MNKTDAINCIQDIIDVANSHGSAVVYRHNGGLTRMENVLECLRKSAPAETVRHGHWIDRDHGLQMCSECGEESMEDRDDLPFKQYEFCPYCGAKMDEEVQDDD